MLKQLVQWLVILYAKLSFLCCILHDKTKLIREIGRHCASRCFTFEKVSWFMYKLKMYILPYYILIFTENLSGFLTKKLELKINDYVYLGVLFQ